MNTENKAKIILETLQSAIDRLNLDQFLGMLSIVDQEPHKSILPPSPDGPEFHWVFRNIDFDTWSNSSDHPVLWLSGALRCNINQIAPLVMERERSRDCTAQGLVLHFSLETSGAVKGTVIPLIHTLLCQVIHGSKPDQKLPIAKRFLENFLNVRNRGAETDWESMGSQAGSSLEECLRNILDAPASDVWAALKRVLSDETERRILIVIDGLYEVGAQTDEIIRGIHGLTKRLPQACPSLKVLFIGQAQYEPRHPFDKFLCIVYDKERQGLISPQRYTYIRLTLTATDCLASLHFSDRRYDKIVKEHKGSLEWIWEHEAYTQWSTSDKSRLLYIEGKPGSGKSTLVKYFRHHLQERESVAESGIMAKFFYSHREGEPHSSHTHMLRAVLCDILHQSESFFYHHFQYWYRQLSALQSLAHGNVIEWDYESLKEVFSSLFDYSLAGRLYIILDAVDESAENDRQDMLQLLLQLCEKTTNYVVRVFVASRPLPVLERSIRECQGLIRLQDETKADIANFARSYLERLEFDGYLEEAMAYIVENAQGMFLWVQLVVTELLNFDEQGRAEGDIFEFLKSLPRELEEFYERMLDKMGRKDADLRHGINMFYFVLFACRPLTVNELLHSIAIQDTLRVDFTPSDDAFWKSVPRERRITYCGGNFIEIKQSHGTTCS